MSIATKTGDTGATSLLFGRRVSKSDFRIECNGAIDELNASLGMARAQVAGVTDAGFIRDAIQGVQKELVNLMGEIAVAPGDRPQHAAAGYPAVTSASVDGLTALVDDLEKNRHVNFARWATPGDSVASAALDVARTVCRRAERHVVSLREVDSTLNVQIVRYLNRLSDLCWLWARWVESTVPPASTSTEPNQ